MVARTIRKPLNNWYDGWEERDWNFLPDVPQELIRMRQFHPAMRYLAGVTADEAAHILCTPVHSFFSCVETELRTWFRLRHLQHNLVVKPYLKCVLDGGHGRGA